MNGKTVLLVAFFATMSLFASAQEGATPASSVTEIQQNYDMRIQQSKLAGQYIPKDLFDAFAELNRLTDAESRNKFMSLSENDVRENSISVSVVG